MPKEYAIRIAASAARALRKIPTAMRVRIARAIDDLASDPFPPGARKLQGEVHAYRIRVGDYRVIYDVLQEELVVLVLRMGHRKDIYR
jgi:mRNA interferase RelE/StbE